LEDYKYCAECGRTSGIEDHHIIHLSQVRSLDKCKANHVNLCYIHHRSSKIGIHDNDELDRKYKLKFQNWLELSFLKHEYTLEEIQEILGISYKATRSLCKMIRSKGGLYVREDIILACMDDGLIEEGNEC
jgi:hypothetical protein